MTYTLKDLEDAQKECKRWNDAWANDSSNNPNSCHGERKRASIARHRIYTALVKQGDIELTPEQQFQKDLDDKHPNAETRKIITFEGNRYQKKYWPVITSRSGETVDVWGSAWVKLEEK